VFFGCARPEQTTSNMSQIDRADFLTHLTSELIACGPRRAFNNIDLSRFPHSPSKKQALKEKALGIAAFFGFYRGAAFDVDRLSAVLNAIGLDQAYALLADHASRDLFVKILAYRILGNRHVRLPLNNQQYWRTRRSVSGYLERSGTVTGIPILGSLDLFNFNGIRLHAHPMNILNTFLLEQYRCPRANVGVRPGDVVIDAGGCWGDTALYFAQRAARVFSFECIPSNIEIMRRNLGLNASLGSKIDLVQKALWSSSADVLAFKDAGPGSRPQSDDAAVSVETVTLDDFIRANSVERVDFIKMDIEGSEPDALAGAERTIRQYRPQLAISIYHDLSHFASIPKWIAGQDLGYRLYLDHFTIHAEETVIFARVGS